MDAENSTGAVLLYERASMRAVHEWVEYAKKLRLSVEESEDTHA